MIPRHYRAHARAGFTMLEAVISVSIFAVVSYGLLTVMEFGRRSQSTVSTIADNNQGRAEVTRQLVNELSVTSDARIAVSTLPDGNTELTFQQPIDVNGVWTWGVYDRRLSLQVEEQTIEGWSLRYTVVTGGEGGLGGLKFQANDQVFGARRLVRQVIDSDEVVQRTDVILDGLDSGGQHPGFKVQKTGDVWEITVSAKGKVAGNQELHSVVYVATRN